MITLNETATVDGLTDTTRLTVIWVGDFDYVIRWQE